MAGWKKFGISRTGYLEIVFVIHRPFFRRLLRSVLRIIGRMLLKLLAQISVSGIEHFPPFGPVILTGNHAGLMEIVMMAVLTPHVVEFIGSGDIPLDPKFAWLADLWGYIPVKRGLLDREAIKRAATVLKQKGTLAIFPEGGIWNPGEMDARLGVALLSNMGNSPILPIGFRNVQGTLNTALHLKRPRLSMVVGELIPPVRSGLPGLSRKQVLEQAAHHVLEQIRRLVPEEAPLQTTSTNHKYSLMISLRSEMNEIKPTRELPETILSALGKFFLHPIILDIFHRNLKLPVDALMDLKNRHNPAEISAALAEVLMYLKTNPGLLTYRFGMDEGLVMQQGLQQLQNIAEGAARESWGLYIQPILIQTRADGSEEIIQDQYLPPGKY